MRIYLFGFLHDDVYGRVVVTPDERSVGGLAQQLTAWSPTPEYRGPLTIRNEVGELLNPSVSIAEAGLRNGDIFTVGKG